MSKREELAQELIDAVTSLLDCPDGDVKGLVRTAREILAEIEAGTLVLEPAMRVSWVGNDGVYRFGTLTDGCYVEPDGTVMHRAYGIDGNFYGVKREALLDPNVVPEYALRPCVECRTPVVQRKDASPALALCEDHAIPVASPMSREEFIVLCEGTVGGWD